MYRSYLFERFSDYLQQAALPPEEGYGQNFIDLG